MSTLIDVRREQRGWYWYNWAAWEGGARSGRGFAPVTGSCNDISDADFAWGTNLKGGWQHA